MITFKQLEALYWIARLGSFAAAADKLFTTQSAISKRVQELETQFQVEVFDRSKRSARLTEKGSEILHYATGLLEQRDQFIERASDSTVMIRHFTLGVTELTAMTWLPRLVQRVRSEFPRVTIAPEVDLSASLFERLIEETIDLIVIPDVFSDSRCVSVPLATVENAWMAAPEVHAGDAPLSHADLAQFTLLVQGNRSGTGLVYGRWLAEHGVGVGRTIPCESLVAQVGFTVSGLGVSYLPVPVMAPLLQAGRLRRLPVQGQLPQVRYAVYYRADRESQFRRRVTEIATETCSFQSFFSA